MLLVLVLMLLVLVVVVLVLVFLLLLLQLVVFLLLLLQLVVLIVLWFCQLLSQMGEQRIPLEDCQHQKLLESDMRRPKHHHRAVLYADKTDLPFCHLNHIQAFPSICRLVSELRVNL